MASLRLLSVLSLLGLCAGLAAGQGVSRPVDAAAIASAVDNGVQYLLSVQGPQGGWGSGTGPGSGKGWLVGYTSLVGVALVEAGVPPRDPRLQQALACVRRYVNDLDSTYEVALAILFLDRMGDKKDRKTIQMLAGRLIAGQTATGGWGYRVPKLTAAEHESLMTALRKLNPPLPPPPPSFRDRPRTMHLCIKGSDDVWVRPPPPAPDPAKVRTGVINSLPPAMRRWPVFLEPAELTWAEPAQATSDNSNTHFATVALWAARRHEVPVDPSLALLAQRFRSGQGSDGTWGYHYRRQGGGGSKSMTCVGLLGLAIGHVVNPEPDVKPEQDQRIIKGFRWLSRQIGAPVGHTEGRPSPKEVGGLYYLWAMERIAVLYDVANLDRKDWYLWGAEILLAHQARDGSWPSDGGYHGQHPVLNTAFALLFLTRANLTPDLSRRLVVDQTALVAKVDQPPPSPREPQPPPPRATEPEPQPEPAPQPRPEPRPAPQPSPPPPPATVAYQPPTPSAADVPVTTTTSQSSDKPLWAWILLVVLLLIFLGIVVAVIVLRKPSSGEEEVEDDKPVQKRKRTSKA